MPEAAARCNRLPASPNGCVVNAVGCVASSEWTSAVFPLLIAAVKAASMRLAGVTDAAQ